MRNGGSVASPLPHLQLMSFHTARRPIIISIAIVVLSLAVSLTLTGSPAHAYTTTFANKSTSISGNVLTVSFDLPSDKAAAEVDLFGSSSVNTIKDNVEVFLGWADGGTSTPKNCGYGSCTLSVSPPPDVALNGDTQFRIEWRLEVYTNSNQTSSETRIYRGPYVLVKDHYDATPLDAPTLTVTADVFELDVSFSLPSNANQLIYRVYEGDAPDLVGQNCNTNGGLTSGSSTSSFNVTGLDADTEYAIAVCVTPSSFEFDTSPWEVTPTSTLDPTPTLRSGRIEGDQQVTIQWEAVAGTVVIEYGEKDQGYPDSVSITSYSKQFTNDTVISQFNGAPLDNGTTYQFQLYVELNDGTQYRASRTDLTATPSRTLRPENFTVFATPDTTKVYDASTDLKGDETTGGVGETGIVCPGDSEPCTVTSVDGSSQFNISLDGGQTVITSLSELDSGDGDSTANDHKLHFTWKLFYGDKNVGQNKEVFFSSIEISGGDDAAEWNLDDATGGSTDAVDDTGSSAAAITPAPLTLDSFAIVDKEYDGGVDADNDGNNPFDDDRIAGDDLSFDWTASFSDKNVGQDKTVTVSDISISGGADQGNYALQTPSGTTTASITPTNLTLSNFSAEDKIYDGTTDVPVGTFDDDRVTVNGVEDDLEFDFTATFDGKNVKDGEGVSFSNISISGGADQGNYNLVTTAGTGSANIVERPVHLDGTRVYDATRLIEASDIAITSRDVADTGLVGDETLVVEGAGWIATKNAGVGLTLEKDAPPTEDPVEGATGFTLSDGENGGLASNYTLVGGTHTVTVTPAPVTFEGVEGVERIYDGTTTVELDGGALVGVVEGDVLSVANNEEGEADSADVGSHDVTTEITLTGVDAPNYALTQPVPEVEITTRELTVSGLRVLPKTYDGSTRASLAGATLVNVAEAGSAVSLTGARTGTFVSANAGVQAVNYTLGLTGDNAKNYTLTSPGPLTGRIDPAAAQLRFVSGLTWVEGATGLPRVVTSPPGLDTDITFPNGGLPSSPGDYTVQASITDPNYEPSTISATFSVLPAVEDERVTGVPTIGPVPLSDIPGRDSSGEGSLDGPGGGLGGLAAGQVITIGPDGPISGVTLREASPQSVVIDGGDFTLELQAEDDTEQPRELNAAGRVELVQGTWARVTGSGFTPGTDAEAWLFSTPRFIGAVAIDAQGGFEARLPVPADIDEGIHTLQLNALDQDGELRSVSLGVEVVSAPPVVPSAEDQGSGAEAGAGLLGAFGFGIGAEGGAWLLVVLVLGLALIGWFWWFILWRRRRRDDEDEDVYVPEEFGIDWRVDSEYRK